MTIYEYIIKHCGDAEILDSKNELLVRGEFDNYTSNILETFRTDKWSRCGDTEDRNRFLFRGEEFNLIHSENISIDDDLIFPEDTRRPWFQIRGKQVSEEQALQIIVGTTPLFHGWDLSNYMALKEKWSDSRRYSDIIYREHSGMSPSTWIYPNGIICQNDWSSIKYPYFDEIVPDWLDIAKKYPYLDMIIAYSEFDEAPCYFCPLVRTYEEYSDKDGLDKDIEDSGCYACNMKELERCYSLFKDYPNKETLASSYPFNNNMKSYPGYVSFALWIHDGKFEILNRKRASEVYKEYAEKYEPTDMRYVYKDYWHDSMTPILDDAYLIKCFEYAGLDGQKALDASYELGFVNHFEEPNEWRLKHKEVVKYLVYKK